jgi:hypothetical protein
MTTTLRVFRPARALPSLFASGAFKLRPLCVRPILGIPGKFSISPYGLA